MSTSTLRDGLQNLRSLAALTGRQEESDEQLRQTPAFVLEDLILGQKFELDFHSGKRTFEQAPKPVHSALEVKAGECRDLGAIQRKPVPESSEQ